MRRLLLAASLLAVSPFAAGSAHAANASLVGSWYSEGVESGMYAQFIKHENSDGTFWLDVRQLDQKDCHLIKTWLETGTWQIVNNVVMQTTSTVDGMPADFHDAYKIVSLTQNEFIWFDPDTQLKWVSPRLPDDNFPPPTDCNATS